MFLTLIIIAMSKPGFTDSDTILISNKKELHQLSQDASFDQWSLGKTVILEADIDLGNEVFTPIPIFAGIFDGNGHTITGLNIRAEGSAQGLFRYLEEGGVIKDLSVEGTIRPNGDRDIIGGIVGHNEGTIENSKFIGIVKGRDTVGGLVGFNATTGDIVDSSFQGEINGETQVGGITGYNSGIVLRSINKSEVNTIIKSNHFYSDIGGIVGVNIGVINDAENIGQVGYPSMGYNIGGIAGRQSGYIKSSTNYGAVYGRKEVGGIVGKMEPYENLIIPPSKLEELEDEIGSLETASEKMITNAERSSQVIDVSLSGLQRNINNTKDHVQTLINQTGEEINQSSYRRAKENFFSSINNISTSISNINTNIGTQNNTLVDDMEAVNDGFFDVTEILMNIIEELTAGELETEDIVTDVSREVVSSNTEGTVSDSRNLGIIHGDSNVGGIAGTMSFILNFDPKIDLDVEDRLTINTVLETQSIVRDSESTGHIISRLNNVGGITGHMEHGYITDCIASGTIESTNGNYIGGIAGQAYGAIDSSYVKSILKGKDYIGGIAGYGKEITNSYTLIQIDKSNAYIGAIAGDVTEDSTIERNYFVNDILNGIDGISYAGHAEPMEYEDFISSSDIPQIFEEFILTFKLDNKLVDTLTFEYGDSLLEEDMPEIPLKEGYYGRWQIDNTNITFDKEVHGEYVPYLTILESEERRDNVLSTILVEGKFTQWDSLALNKIEIFVDEEEQEPLEQWRLNIPEDGQATHTIRYYPPDGYENLDIYVLNKEHWIKTDSKLDGNYLVFESSDTNVTFRLVEGEPVIEYLILSFIIVFIIAFVIVKIYGKWESRRKRKSGEAS